jgi:pimeloyl-ACP methyl ester carboxylesterase
MELPEGYVSFEEVHKSAPEPELIRVSDDVELETLHIPGPEPTLVFVHGGLGSLWNPYPQIDAFRDDYGTVSYALAGNGSSSRRPEQSVEGHSQDLRNLLDELDVEYPIIHGHSYGTAVAIEYAKRYPTEGLVLHAGGSHDLTPEFEKPFLRLALVLRFYRLPINSGSLHRLASRIGFHEETPGSVVKDFLKSNPIPNRRSAWETVTGAFWGYDGRGELDRIDSPTLVVNGPADRIVPVEVGWETAERIPHTVFCRLERTGHVGMVERPETYNRLLRSFVEFIR